MILDAAAILALAAQCAPSVDPSTMLAIVRTESAGHIFALGVNGTKSPPRPKDAATAATLAKRYIRAGYSVDLGLAQINSRNLLRLGMTIETVLDPCQNLAAGAVILAQNYAAQTSSAPAQVRLRAALSMYNTGSPSRGFANGYVAKVVANAGSVAELPRSVPAGAIARGTAIGSATEYIQAPQSLSIPPTNPAPAQWDVFARSDQRAPTAILIFKE